MKKSIKRLSVILSGFLVTVAMAMPISAESTNQEITGDGSTQNENSVINLNIPAQYYVSIPSSISSETRDDLTYTVKVYGDVSAEDVVYVTPDATMTLEKASGDASDVSVGVTQTTTSFAGTTIGATEDVTTAVTTGTVGIAAKASDLTAGKWSGTLSFSIVFENN